MDAIRRHVRFFTGLGSRVVGYPGCEAAASYIRDWFVSHGLSEVYYQNFSLAIPFDEGSFLEVLSAPGFGTIQLHPLMPNVVTTSTCNVTGPLLYVGRGELSDFTWASQSSGVDINGSIVLLDFNSHFNWLYAAKLGAKAVIFLSPNELTTVMEAELKRVNVPLKFPRFYLPVENATDLIAQLRRGNVTVRLTSKQVLRRVTGRNVIGFMPGTEPEYQSKYIMLTSYYDSASIVPSLAPGANEATGTATLLELVRVLSENPPLYPIIFVAFSGHDSVAWGSRNFFFDYLWESTNL